ncbi:MAG: ABC transporter permease [Longimicrobiales bacterium]
MDLLLDALAAAIHLIFAADRYLLDIVARSLAISGSAVLLGVVLGLPVGIAVGIGRFRGRRVAITLIHTGFALPPVVVGLFVYLMLSRQGPLGGLGWLFTPAAMITAQALLAAPYVAGITLAAVQAVPPDVRWQARALGASRLRALWVHVREARLGLVAAVVAGFGAVISEVGAVMMVGGNIVGETRVMTTAIVLETRRGNFGLALALGGILLLLAFVVNLLLTRAQQGATDSSLDRPWA